MTARAEPILERAGILKINGLESEEALAAPDFGVIRANYGV